jgi:hypothetical protein
MRVSGSGCGSFVGSECGVHFVRNNLAAGDDDHGVCWFFGGLFSLTSEFLM